MVRVPPKVIAATILVALAPAAAVWALRAAGVVESFLGGVAVGAVLSLAACQLAAWLWQRRPGAEDVLFGDLMLWGWLRRCAAQRRLQDAVSLLGLRRVAGASDPEALSVARRAALLERLASDLEARDPYTHGHSRRVARYAGMIAKRMGASRAELARIRTAAAVHDVGKLDTPIEVLHKPGRLTDEEFEIVKRHAPAGARMVAILEDPELTAIVRHHHERLDGTGYPDRLAGEAIPLGARIIAVADTFDAITSARSYRQAKPHKAAIEILRAEAGTQLDGDAVAAFCSVYLGRRGLGAWVALCDLTDRIVTWVIPDALAGTARVAAIAATTAAVSGGVIALPASAKRGAPARPGTRTSLAAGATAHGAQPAAISAGRSAGAGGFPTLNRTQLRGSFGRSRGHGAGGSRASSAPTAQQGSAGATGAGTTVLSTDGTAPDGNASGVALSAAPVPGGGQPAVSLSVGGDPNTGSTGSGVHVTAGSNSGTANVGVSAGGGSGPSVSAGVTLGPAAGGGSGASGSGAGSGAPSVSVTGGGSGSSSGANVQATVPGVASVNVHLP